MRNLYQVFKSLLPEAPLQAGKVVALQNATVTVELPDKSRLHVRGSAQPGQMVLVRNGLIEAVAPELPVVLIEV